MQKKVKIRREYRAIGIAGKRAKTALGYVPRCDNMYYHDILNLRQEKPKGKRKMPEKIITTKTLQSGITAICCETIKDNFSIEIAANCLFLHSDDVPGLISMLHEIDLYFLRK